MQKTSRMNSLGLVAAIGENNELGYGKELLWRIKEDMQFFKSITMNSFIIMGRTTYETMPKTLQGRKYIILTKNPDFKTEDGHVICKDLNQVLNFIDSHKRDLFYVVGGGMIYKLFLPYVDHMYLTEIEDISKKANVFFPEFDKDDWYEMRGEDLHCDKNNIYYHHSLYLRKTKDIK